MFVFAVGECKRHSQVRALVFFICRQSYMSNWTFCTAEGQYALRRNSNRHKRCVCVLFSIFHGSQTFLKIWWKSGITKWKKIEKHEKPTPNLLPLRRLVKSLWQKLVLFSRDRKQSIARNPPTTLGSSGVWDPSLLFFFSLSFLWRLFLWSLLQEGPPWC